LDDFAKDAHQLLLWKNIPDGDRVIAVGYSMGGQVMRLTAAKWSGHFTDQVIIASSGRRGMRFFGLCRGVWVVLKAFTTSLVTGWIKLTTVEEIHGLFFNKRLMDSVAREHYKIILGHLHPESRWACLRLGVPLIRQRAPALSGKVHMILPEDDVMFRDELDGRCKCGEDWKIIPVRGGHGAILDYEAMEHALHQVDWSD
jgi:pimeloyl-ACP methyl ester carboxylesterase